MLKTARTSWHQAAHMYVGKGPGGGWAAKQIPAGKGVDLEPCAQKVQVCSFLPGAEWGVHDDCVGQEAWHPLQAVHVTLHQVYLLYSQSYFCTFLSSNTCA